MKRAWAMSLLLTSGAAIMAVPWVSASSAAPRPSTIDADLVNRCHGSFTGGNANSPTKKSLSMSGPDGSGVYTLNFTVTYPTQVTRNGGSLTDCIRINQKLVASISDLSDLTSGVFSGFYTIGPNGSGADLVGGAGDRVCDVAFLTGNATGGGGPSGQKTVARCVDLPTPPTTTTTLAPTTTTTLEPTTTTTLEPTTTTTVVGGSTTTTTLEPTTTTTVVGGSTTTTTEPDDSDEPDETTTTVAGALPATGSNSSTALVALGLVAAGGIVLGMTRRPRRS